MFYDKQSMTEMYELSLAKKKRTGRGWELALLTSATNVYEMMSDADFLKMHQEWLHLIKKVIHKNDAAYLINDGNVFLLLSEHHAATFKQDVEEHVYIRREGKGEIRSKITFLNEDLAKFLLTIN